MEKILVTKATMPSLEEYMAEIQDLFDSHWITNGGLKSRELKGKLKEYLGVENLSLFTNGHLALELSLQALNLSGEVITTPFTFASTTHAIVRNGLKPVFCDIDENDYTLDVSKLEELITDQTSAILPVHVYGNIGRVEEIEQIAKKYNLKVIYDAAHAFGESYKGEPIGNLGDLSMFSFHATKVFHTIEGGATCYKNPELTEKLLRLKNFGIRNEVVVDSVGSNAKMNEFQAAMGLCNLRTIDELIALRKQVSERYTQNLKSLAGLQLNSDNPDVKSNYSYYPVVVDEKKCGVSRNELIEALQQENIFPRRYFYPLVSDFDCFQGEFDSSRTPVASKIAERVMTLPLYPDLPLKEVDRICEIIVKLIK